jgi:hypothetical protein
MLRAAILALLPGLVTAAAVGDLHGVRATAPPPPPISAVQWRPQPGDLVFRASEDVVGSGIRASSGDAAIYSHVGIVVTRGDRAFVLDVSPFGTGTVNFNEVDSFTRDPATTDLLIVRPRAGLDHGRLNQAAERLAAAGIPFDYDFDMSDSRQLYCAELAYNLLRDAGVDLSSVAWIDMYVPLVGNRYMVTPDALARATTLARVWRRT